MSARRSHDGKAPVDDDPNKLSKLEAQNRNAKPSTSEGLLPRTPSGLRLDTTGPPISPFPARRKIVFPDPIAFQFVQDDPSVTVLTQRETLARHELYLVEQWACSRRSPTLVIATYTGDESQSIVVGVLEIPAERTHWSPRLRLYFNAIEKYHGRPRETVLGELMVTNLNSFPSALTVIPVPGGDIRAHRLLFIVNENLKRMGCAGRSAMTLSEPSPPTQGKFYQLYRISDRVPFHQAVLELVKLCQVALSIFGKLEQEYIDGLLCDVTETAIGNWWTEVGAEHYNLEPSDGILGPTTVAALLGMLMGARNRLHYLGMPVSKDVFDVETTKRGISYFQKERKLERTRRLDRPTLLRLHRVTAKAASGEGWGVQKAVKSTVSEIGGKRGEMVMGMVGGKGKAGIGDVETLDIDRFAGLASGEMAKWLWHGKPRRSTGDHSEKEQQHDVGAAVPGGIDDEPDGTKRKESPDFPSSDAPAGSALGPLESPDREASRKKVFKSVAGKMSDARTGLGRIKDAVGGGLRGHSSRPSISAGGDALLDGSSAVSTASSSLTQPSASLSSPLSVGGSGAALRTLTWKTRPEEYPAGTRTGIVPELVETPADMTAPAPPFPEKAASVDGGLGAIGSEVRRGLSVTAPPSVSGSVVGDNDLSGPVLASERSHGEQFHLHRRHSIELARLSDRNPPNENRWPRRMSFGEAADSVLRWDDIVDVEDDDDGDGGDPAAEALGRLTQDLYGHIEAVRRDVQPWVLRKIGEVEAVDARYARTQHDLQALYRSLSEAYRRVQQSSAQLVGDERANAAESLREMDILSSRLEYEIGALESRVKDVEDGVVLFERQVEDLERRAGDLKAQLERESFLHWIVRTLTGIGTGPNVTRVDE